MQLSLSVRIVEAPCKTKLLVPLEPFLALAKEAGYDAICMRASAAGVGTPVERLREIRQQVQDSGLTISMVTADSDVPLNNDAGPQSLRQIDPSLDVAEALGCDLIRVCLKKEEDVAAAQGAADLAAARGIRLAHQCHSSSLFEQVEPMLGVLARIDRPNFGLIYEPANLMICGQSYGPDTIQRLGPYLFNAYVQNHRLDPEGPVMYNTYCRGPVRYHDLDPWEEGGVDLEEVFAGLKSAQYDRFFTIHQAQGLRTVEEASEFAVRCARLMRRWIPAI